MADAKTEVGDTSKMGEKGAIVVEKGAWTLPVFRSQLAASGCVFKQVVWRKLA